MKGFTGIPAGFVFGFDGGGVTDSKMINEEDHSAIPGDAFNGDNLAIKDSNGKYFTFVCGNGDHDGYYISSYGTKIDEWSLYEHMSEEDESQYDVMNGIVINEFGFAELEDE